MTNQLHAQQAGASLPKNEDGPTLAEVAHQDKQEGRGPDCPGTRFALQALDASREDRRKSFATTQAELALCGYSLIETDLGFEVSRWNHAAFLPDLDAVRGFLLRVGGKP